MIERTGTRPEQATPVPDAPFVRANGETRAGVSLPAMTRFVRAIEPRESEHRLRPKVRLALQPTPRPCTAGGASIQAQRRTGGRCHRSRERSAVPEVAAFLSNESPLGCTQCQRHCGERATCLHRQVSATALPVSLMDTSPAAWGDGWQKWLSPRQLRSARRGGARGQEWG